MYGAVICPGCRKPRVTNLSSRRSTCPRCGKTVEIRKTRIHFQSEDLHEVRDFVNSMTLREERLPADPISILQEGVRKEKDMEEKLLLAARGLTRIRGSFSMEDMESVFPGKGETMMQKMVDNAMIVECRPGFYQVI